MTVSVVVHSATLLYPDGTIHDSWVEMRGAWVEARGQGDSWRERVPRTAEVVDAQGAFLSAGFIDVHCHGGGGQSVTSDLRTVLDTHSQHGTTRLVASLVSAPVPVLCAQLAEIAAWTEADSRLLGAHLEGPFLADTHRGAHSPDDLRDATVRDVLSLIDAAAGTLVQVTLAPERPGSSAAMALLQSRGVVIAIGHTAAGMEEAGAAFSSGAGILTHAFNGMPGLHHRAPGPVLAAVKSSEAILEVISDGVHVHPDVVNLLFRLAPGRVALISDAMAAAGAGDGSYALGALDVEVREGVARLASGDSIAGSTLTLDASLRHTVNHCNVSLHEAVAAMTSVPARAIGRDHDLGRLDPGYCADAVLLSQDLTVQTVWADGKRLH